MANNLGNSKDLVEISDVQQDALIMKDGSLRRILMVSGVNFSLKSQDDQDSITLAYQAFLNSIDFPLQIVVHSRKINTDNYLSKLEDRKKKEISPLLRSQIDEYIEFVRQFVSQNAIMEKSFFVSVPWYPLYLKKSKSGLLDMLPFGKGKKGDKKGNDKENKGAEEASSHQDISEELPALNQRVEQVVDGLSAVGLQSVVLNNEQLIELLYNFYNPGTVEKQGVVNSQENTQQNG